MAFTDRTIGIGQVHCLATDGKRTKTRVGVNLNTYTEAQARTKLATLAEKIQAISAAAVTHYSLTRSSDDQTITIDDPNGEPYSTIEDRVELEAVSAGLDKPVVIQIPAPVEALVDSAKREIVDFTNAALQDVIAWAADYAADYAKQALVEVVRGIRGAKRVRNDRTGAVPLVP